MKTFRLRIITPEGPVFEGEVGLISMRSSVGSFGVMANHAPMIAECPPGALRATDGHERELIFECDSSVFLMDGTVATVLTAFALAKQLPKGEMVS